MSEYQALTAYVSVLLVVFLGGLLWNHYRTTIKRRLNLKDYRDTSEHDDRDTPQAPTGTHAGVASR